MAPQRVSLRVGGEANSMLRVPCMAPPPSQVGNCLLVLPSGSVDDANYLTYFCNVFFCVHGGFMVITMDNHGLSMDYHGRSMECGWTIYGPILSMDCAWTRHGPTMSHDGLSMAVHGLSMEPPWTVHGLLWATTTDYHGQPRTTIDCSRTTIDYQELPRALHVLPWTLDGLRSTTVYHGLQRTVRGLFMDYHGLTWTTMDYHGLFKDYRGLPWTVHGLPWTVHGLPRTTMGYHYHGLSWTLHTLSWTTMDYHGPYRNYHGLSMNYHGLPWTAMDCSWSTMDDHGLFVHYYGLPWATMDSL